MEEPAEKQTLKEKFLFYTTAFFVLLGTFSLFAFLFLVPFVIDPAFTTIFMQFEPRPAQCMTSEMIMKRGTKNCTWASCREGCTKEVYNCTQIRVDYRLAPSLENLVLEDMVDTTSPAYTDTWEPSTLNEWSVQTSNNKKVRPTYYDTSPIEWSPDWIDRTSPHKLNRRELGPDPSTTLTPLINANKNNSESDWFFQGAKLFPNVKGCGYPPMLNCTIFLWKYQAVGTNFSCYYSKIDPNLVVSDLDMDQVYLNLILATAIPIPSFIISVIYLAFAYFVIFAEEPVVPDTTVPGEELEEGEAEDQDDEKKELQDQDKDPDITVDIIEDAIPPQTKTPTPPAVSPTVSGGSNKLPAATMVVRPNSLQPSGPIAAV